MQVLRIDHVVLRVAHMSRMVTFYREAFGCEIERRVDSAGLVQLRAGESLIDLVDAAGPLGRRCGRAPGGEAHNLEHLCLRVVPFDEPALRARLAGLGVEVPPAERRYGADGFGPSVYVDDPEGNRIELKGPPEPDTRISGEPETG